MALEIKHSDRKATIFSVINFSFIISMIGIITIVFITVEVIPKPNFENLMILVLVIITISILILITQDLLNHHTN